VTAIHVERLEGLALIVSVVLGPRRARAAPLPPDAAWARHGL